ncbi:MAG: C-GCAxxG-C-C family protein [Syntrophomonas sp.]
MPPGRAKKIAMQEMKNGCNCCQAVIVSACQVWDLEIPEGILDAASLFGEGMHSGCSCGALTGMIIVSGLKARGLPDVNGEQIANQVHERFKTAFGATCCRAIKKKRSPWERIGKRACIELTGQAAGILVQLWKEYGEHGRSANIGDHPHAQ